MSSSHRTYRRTCNNNVSVDKTSSSSSGIFNECDESRTSFPQVGCRLTLPSISPRTSYNRTKFPKDIICNRYFDLLFTIQSVTYIYMICRLADLMFSSYITYTVCCFISLLLVIYLQCFSITQRFPKNSQVQNSTEYEDGLNYRTNCLKGTFVLFSSQQFISVIIANFFNCYLFTKCCHFLKIQLHQLVRSFNSVFFII